MQHVKRYWPTVTIAFKFAMANRIPYILQVTGDVLQVSVLYFIWSAAYNQADSFGGFDRSQMVTYLFVAQFFRIIVSYAVIETQLEHWIQSGDLIRELVVPLVHLWKDLCMCVGWLLAIGCFSGGVLLAVGFLFFGVQPPSLTLLPALALSLLLAVTISFGLSYLTGTLAFWTDGSIWGISMAKMTLYSFAGGALIPLALFPDWLRTLVSWLPFQAAVHIPTQIWLGQIQGAALWQALGLQLLWAVLLLAAANWFYNDSLRKVTIPGG